MESRCRVCGSEMTGDEGRCTVCGSGGPLPTVREDEKRPLGEDMPGLGRLKGVEPPRGHRSWEDIVKDLEEEYGRDEEGVPVPPETRHDEEALRDLMRIPGVGREQAKLLYDIGYADLESVIRGALHGQKGAESLTKVMALRIRAGGKRDISEVRVRCPTCGTLVLRRHEDCPVCGTLLDGVSLTGKDAEKRVERHAGNVLKAISEDAFFRSMPEDVRREMVTEVKDLLPEDVRERERLKEFYRQKLDKWKKRGFAVDELNSLLENNFEEFLKRGREVLDTAGEGEATPAAGGKISARKRAVRSAKAKRERPGWCTFCGSLWTKGGYNCISCGASIQKMRRCPGCGIPVKKKMRRCPNCRNSLEGES